jgi:hypothetical protein
MEQLKMDGGQLQRDPRLHPRLDHGYAVTSHSSPGQTADHVLIHVLIHVNTEFPAKPQVIDVGKLALKRHLTH